MRRVITFGELVATEIDDFLGTAGVQRQNLHSVSKSLVEHLIVLTEEGQSLSPAVLITNDIRLFLKRIAPATSSQMGNETVDHRGVGRAIKHLGRLTSGRWWGFLCPVWNRLYYGIFLPPQNPAGNELELDSVGMMTNGHELVFIRRRASGNVDLFVPDVSHLTLSTKARGIVPLDYTTADNLAKSILRKCDSASQQHRAALAQCLEDSLQVVHGAMLAVVAHEHAEEVFAKMKSYVSLTSPVDVLQLLSHGSDDDGVTWAGRNVLRDLLEGVLGSDGITVFTNGGLLVSFRSLIDSSGAEGDSGAGARALAFAALSKMPATHVERAICLSHDGHSRHHTGGAP